MFRKVTSSNPHVMAHFEPSSIATVAVSEGKQQHHQLQDTSSNYSNMTDLNAVGNNNNNNNKPPSRSVGGGFVSCVTAASPISHFVSQQDLLEDEEEAAMPTTASKKSLVVPSAMFRHVTADGEVRPLGEESQLGGLLPSDVNLVKPLTLRDNDKNNNNNNNIAAERSFFVLSSATRRALEVVEVRAEQSNTTGTAGSVVLVKGATQSLGEKKGQVTALATSGANVLCGWSHGAISTGTLVGDGSELEMSAVTPIAGFAGMPIEQAIFLQNQSAVALVSSGCIVAPIDVRTRTVCTDNNYNSLRLKSSATWREQVTALGEDGAGTAVIGTASGGLFVYDLRNSKIPLGYLPPSSGVGRGAGITSVTFLSRDSLVTTTTGGEVFQWSTASQLAATTTFPYQATPLMAYQGTALSGTKVVSSCPVVTVDGGQNGFLTVDDSGSVDLYAL